MPSLYSMCECNSNSLMPPLKNCLKYTNLSILLKLQLIIKIIFIKKKVVTNLL